MRRFVGSRPVGRSGSSGWRRVVGALVVAVVAGGVALGFGGGPVYAATVTATIPVGTNPYGVAFTPDGSTAYVTNEGANTVSVINVATGTVTATIPVGTNPIGVAVTPNGSTAYVTNVGANTVSVINVATGTVTATIPVGTRPYAVAFTPNGSTAYVTNYSANTVSVINVATGTVTATIPVGTNPIGVAVTPNGSTAYVTNFNSNTVSVISASATISGVAPAGQVGVAYTFTPTSSGANSFAVIAGALPAGVTLNATTGVVSGTPTTVGTFTYTITATDSGGLTASHAFTTVVAAAAAAAAAATVATTVAGPTVSTSGVAVGGPGFPFGFGGLGILGLIASAFGVVVWRRTRHYRPESE
jgi:YVTN family beta-propeller protein